LDKETQFKTFFKFSSIVTDLFPSAGSQFLDSAFGFLLGNKALLSFIAGSAKKVIRKINRFNSFLFVADLNIGDAVIASSAVAALRGIFPEAEIDFVVKKSTRDFVEGNPDVSNLFPIYEGAPFPSDKDISQLVNLTKDKSYDLIINFSPMIDDRILGENNVVNYTPMAAKLARNERFAEGVNNISFMAYDFINNLFFDSMPSIENKKFKGANIYLSDGAIEEAQDFLCSQEISLEHPLVMFNPDASARFTRIPFEVQRDLLKRLSTLQCTLLLGSGHVEKFIEQKLCYSLPSDIRRNIFIVPPSVKIDVYTALVDMADIFITGDTGPLHLAAARKFARSSGRHLRNKTAIFSVFGGTPPRIYGYDSRMPNFFPANQDAPSRTFIAASPCRNVTCVNKMAKTCKAVRCFDRLDLDEIMTEVSRHLETVESLALQDRYSIPAK
jgi:lipopolysaccharide heptosyltransferase II